MSDRTRLLERGDAVLLIIDVQERINSVMCDQGHVLRIEALLDGGAALDIPILATEQYPNGLGPTIAGIAERLADQPVVKDTFSCTREPEARSAIEGLGRRQVLVAGIEAHVCVLQTAIDLLQGGYDVHVPHDAVNSRRPSDKLWALRRMEAAGVVVTSTESALFELLERCGTDDFKTVAGLVKHIPV